ncbi:unnamed protein product [Schistosoma rodhaini]|uniref:SXP/RAL-2 family protein Ani s 5-like cation-binding domain-containing protein n=1 Tax=Schistosoma rodhaini TaxID=6188 RepID=A0AA85FV19_9TREM|nr:unnamed protein product [Schistosoma rodhaini]
MLLEYNLLINGVTLLISLSGLICEAQSPTKDDINAAISEYGKLYAVNIQIRYKLLIMALKSDINLTLEESYTSAGAAWKLENEDTFRMNMDSYMDVNKTIVPNICMTMLQQKGDRNWDDNIQKKIEYDTPNSKTQANQFDKINKNFNSSLGELKSKVEGLEINRINYLRYKNPMERVTAVLKAMEEEVDHEYVPSY